MRRFGRILLGLLSVVIVGGIAAGSMVWAPDRPVSELAARWAKPPSQFLALDGMQVHYRDEGPREDATPMVLLHGTSSTLHTWDGWTDALRSDHRVIRLDLPGFALTGPRPDGDYTMDAYVRFLLAFLDRLQVRRFTVAGNSFGGGLAWETALRAPDRVAALILVDAGGYATRPTSVPLGFRIAQMPPFNHAFEYFLPRGVIESSLRNVYGDPSKVTPDIVDLYFDMAVRAGNRQALVSRMTRIGVGSQIARIAEIKQPTLILWGEEDKLVPPDNAEKFHRDIAGSRVVVMPGLGHVPQEEDPAATVAAVREFLKGLPAQ